MMVSSTDAEHSHQLLVVVIVIVVVVVVVLLVEAPDCVRCWLHVHLDDCVGGKESRDKNAHMQMTPTQIIRMKERNNNGRKVNVNRTYAMKISHCNISVVVVRCARRRYIIGYLSRMSRFFVSFFSVVSHSASLVRVPLYLITCRLLQQWIVFFSAVTRHHNDAFCKISIVLFFVSPIGLIYSVSCCRARQMSICRDNHTPLTSSHVAVNERERERERALCE
jgi:hypothetical protein